MTQEPINWNQNIEETSEKKYKALVRSLRRRKGFGLLFVECSPAQGKRLIEKIKADLPQKKIAAWNLDRSIDKFYDLVEELVKKEQINILFIQGLEYSLYEYEEIKRGSGWESGDIYDYSWKGVPQILNHLNQQR